jgi:hypothetical protein
MVSTFAIGLAERTGRIDTRRSAINPSRPVGGNRLGSARPHPSWAWLPLFTSARIPARAIRGSFLFLKIFFCRHQAQDLRQMRAPPNLTI